MILNNHYNFSKSVEKLIEFLKNNHEFTDSSEFIKAFIECYTLEPELFSPQTFNEIEIAKLLPSDEAEDEGKAEVSSAFIFEPSSEILSNPLIKIHELLKIYADFPEWIAEKHRIVFFKHFFRPLLRKYDISEALFEEAVRLYNFCNKNVLNTISAINSLGEKNKSHEIQERDSLFKTRAVMEYGQILINPNITCPEEIHNQDKGLMYYFREKKDPEFCKRVIKKVYASEQNIKNIQKDKGAVYSNADEMIKFFNALDFDLSAIAKTCYEVNKHLVKNEIDIDSEITIRTAEKIPKEQRKPTIH